jgi:amyloid beta precursor protein binding protein 1
VDARVDNPPEDLRLYSPWPELSAYADSFDLDSMNSTEHSHTPYVVLLLKYLKQWKETVSIMKFSECTDLLSQHDGKLPSNYSEKNAFRDIVIKGSRKAESENFNEAYKAVIKHCAPTRVSSFVECKGRY